MVLAQHVALGTAFAYVGTYDKGLLPCATPTSAVLFYVYIARMIGACQAASALFTPYVALFWLLLFAIAAPTYKRQVNFYVLAVLSRAAPTYKKQVF